MNNQPNEVMLCPSVDCEFYPIRKGKSFIGVKILKRIKSYCLNCGEGTSQDAKKCELKDCLLYPFRLGRNPNRKGLGNPNPFNRQIKCPVGEI